MRTLILGLDGAAPSFIEYWAERGVLPFLGGAMADGASGVLASTVPPYTPTAWTSIVTGVNPGRHGVFGFTRVVPGGHEVMVDSGATRVKPIWEVLAGSGRPSVVVNVPITYPPRATDGVLVSGMGTPPGAARFAWPDAIHDLIAAEVPGYVPDVSVGQEARRSGRGARRAVDDIERALDGRLRLAETLLTRFPWDFAMVVFETPDRLQHLFWKEVAPGAPLSPDQARVLGVYRRLDAGLSRLVGTVEAFGPVVVLVISDHGFQSLDWVLAVNNHLAAGGFLALRRVPNVSLAARRLPPGLRTSLARAASPIRRTGGQGDANRAIDWRRTVAYSGGVFEQGIHVAPSARPGTAEEVEAALMRLASPSGEGPALEGVLRREAIYSGPCVGDAPNLFPRFRVPGVLMVPRVAGSAVWEAVRAPQGTHHPDGLLAAFGPGVAPRRGLAARAEDVAATALSLLGGPIPTAMEGRPIRAIAPDPEARADIDIERPRASADHDEPTTAYTPAQERQVVERLQGLGYFD